MGSLYWQLNDVWPGASWSSIDFFGRWKALQFQARRFYADVAVAALRSEGNTNLSVISDKVDKFDAELRLRISDLDGRVLRSERSQVTVEPLAATPVWQRSDQDLLQGADPGRTTADFELVADGKTLARSTVYFVSNRDLKLADPQLEAHIVTDPSGVRNAFRLSIKSRLLARAVWIDFGAVDVDLDDNSMDIHAGDEVLIPFRSAASLQTLQEHLTLRSLVDSTLR